MESLLTSIAVVALSEMGDKTQLLAFSLAARFRRPAPILAGILVATVANHSIAAAAGAWVAAHVAPAALAWGLALSFAAFGVWALKPDRLDDAGAEGRTTGLGAFAATAALFFVAEIGDKTQLATAALGARYGQLAFVTTGTTLGMLVADAPAVLLGDRLAGRIPFGILRWAAAIAFFSLAIASAWVALRS